MAGIDSYAKLVLHCDGSDAATTFTDSSLSAHTVTANGNAQVDTAQSKFGGASLLCDGTGDFLSVPDHADFALGSGDFTIDFWVRASSWSSAFRGLVNKRSSAALGYGFVIAQDGTTIDCFLSSDGSTWDIASSESFGAPTANTWHHIALVRSGSTFYKFFDGTSAGTFTSAAALVANADPLRIGAESDGYGFAGWLDELRISKGIARWTANFTPPPEPYSGPTSIGSPQLPKIGIEIDFANDPTSSARTWRDITTYVRQFAITRGRKDALSRPEVGTLSLTLQNEDGHFDPTNTAGDYYPNVLPMRRIRVIAQWDSVIYNLFHGYIEDWPLSFPDHNKNALVEVRAVDALAVLNLFDLSGKSYAAQASDVRGSAVLVDCGFGTAEMNLRTGQSTMVASGTIAAGNTAQAMILDVSASENGLWLVDAGGTWVFQDRHFRQTQKSSASGTVGTQGGQIGYRDIRTSYGAADLANIVKVTANGGTAETATDTSSTASYYQRSLTWPVSGTYLVSSQNEALSAAQYIKTLYSTPALRVPEVVAVPAGATANWPTVLAAELSDRLAVAHVRPDGGTITGDKHLEGLGHAVTFEREWTVTLALSDADAQAFWSLGNANLSELGETTTLGY